MNKNRDYRILIADDEQIECIALELLLKNTFADIQILPSASNGVEFISSVRKNQPDIVIVDINMPGLSGLDALDMIRNQYPGMKIILHSAYSEFSYAKRALALNAFDYIVKPVQKPVFIEMMKNVFRSLDQEREKKTSEENIHQLAREANRLVENDLMSSILLGSINTNTSRLFLHSLSQEYCGGFMVTVRMTDNPIAVWNQQKADELLSALNQICICLGKLYHHDLILYIIPGQGVGESHYREWANSLFSMRKESFLYGVSTWKYSIDELPDALMESGSVLIGKKESGIYFFEYAEPVQLHNPFTQEKNRLSGLVLTGNINECCHVVSTLIDHAAGQGVPLAPLQIYTAYFLIFLYEQTTNKFSSPFYTESQLSTAFRELLSCVSYEELEKKLCRAIHQLYGILHQPANKSREYVNKGIIYIRKMFSQNVSLEEISQLVGISPFYLSRLLKQELNKTFVEVLTEVRITEALKLLQDHSKTIREISKDVGYLNPNYFYKVFKKQTGMTVGEIRRYL